jgi:hypothetical protein
VHVVEVGGRLEDLVPIHDDVLGECALGLRSTGTHHDRHPMSVMSEHATEWMGRKRTMSWVRGQIPTRDGE